MALTKKEYKAIAAKIKKLENGLIKLADQSDKVDYMLEAVSVDFLTLVDEIDKQIIDVEPVKPKKKK